MQPPKNRERVTINIPTQVKRRLAAIAHDKHTSVSDLLVDGANNEIAHYDEERSYPDYVAERVTSVLNSQMQIINNQRQLLQTMHELADNVEHINQTLEDIKKGGI